MMSLFPSLRRSFRFPRSRRSDGLWLLAFTALALGACRAGSEQNSSDDGHDADGPARDGGPDIEASAGGAGGGPEAAGGGTGGTGGGSGGSGGGQSSGVAGAINGADNHELGANQCGVAAPPPATTGQCTTLSGPTFVDFDDHSGTSAASYTFRVGAAQGAILHIDDGSGANGESVIATEMTPGVGDAGYALQISNTNATNWGGLLIFYLQGSATALSCLDASTYGGVALSVKGSSPSGRFGVNLSTLDTTPVADNGLCTNAVASDCKDATDSYPLPEDPNAWRQIQIPWSAFTPGMGTDATCVPNDGTNLVRVVVQPFMNYPPPDYVMEPGPYSLTVDDVHFYGEAPTEGFGADAVVGTADCELPANLQWTSAATPLVAPPSDTTHELTAIKDPTVVRHDDRWHVYASSVSTAGAYNLLYTSFSDWSEAGTAPVYYMDQTPGFDTYVAAPQLFHFTPQDKWYLVFQSGPPMYSTNDDPADPTGWTPPAPFYASTPAVVTEHGGGWLDYWVICDAEWCHLFFSSNQGRWFRSKTAIADFPNGFGEPVVVMHNANSGRVFEGSNVYKVNGAEQYLALIEAFDETSGNRRYYRSWVADSLEGPWSPWQGSGSFPFVGARNVTFEGTPWTNDISHGEMIRSGYDETLSIDPCNMQYLYQGADPLADNGGDYNKIPWHLGLLTQVP